MFGLRNKVFVLNAIMKERQIKMLVGILSCFFSISQKGNGKKVEAEAGLIFPLSPAFLSFKSSSKNRSFLARYLSYMKKNERQKKELAKNWWNLSPTRGGQMKGAKTGPGRGGT